MLQVQDTSDTEEHVFDVDMGDSCIRIEGNLFFNNAMRNNLSFNNKHYHRIYSKKTGRTNHLNIESDDDSEDEKYDKNGDNGRNNLSPSSIGNKQISCKI